MIISFSAQICLDIPECVVWTLDNRENQKRCIPKSKNAGTNQLYGHISGTRQCGSGGETNQDLTHISTYDILDHTSHIFSEYRHHDTFDTFANLNKHPILYNSSIFDNFSISSTCNNLPWYLKNSWISKMF